MGIPVGPCSLLLSLAIGACTPSPGTRPVEGDTGAPPTGPDTEVRPGPPIPPGIKRDGTWSAQAGTDLATLSDPSGDTAWIVGAPNAQENIYEDGLISTSFVTTTRWVTTSLAEDGSRLFAPDKNDYWSAREFGESVQGPGDVTGNGWGDIVIGGRSSLHVIEGRFSTDGDSPRSPTFSAWEAYRPIDAPCGNLVGDETPDLCVHSGIIEGPIQSVDDLVLFTAWASEGPLHVAVAGDPDGDGQEGLWIADETGNLWHVDTFPSGPVDPASVADASTPWSASPDPVLLGDIDLTGDGVPDLVVGQEGEVTVFDLSAGSLEVFTVIPTDRPTWAVASGDFDGDGAADLAVGGAHEVHVYHGPLAPGEVDPEGDAVWAGLRYPFDGFGHSLATQDGDGDGRDELAVGAPEDFWTDTELAEMSYATYSLAGPWGALYVIPGRIRSP